MQRLWAIGLAVLMGLAGCGQSSRSTEAGEPLGKELDPAIAAVYPALVRIWVVMAMPQEGRMQKFQAAGSGAIISADGYVVTNHHVAGDATDIRCDLPDGERIEADLVGTDPLADIAVIKLRLNSRRDPNKQLSVAHFGDSNQVRVGDTVFAMGSPAALSQSVTKGIVSNTRLILPVILPEEMMRIDGEPVGSLVRWIGHDAIIYGGNSGGPLVNTHGEMVGINEIGLATMSGAIPSNLVKEVAQDLMARGTVQRSWIGIEPQPRLRGTAGKGVLVGGVLKGSPAASAGMRVGDFITRYGESDVDAEIAEELPPFNRLVLSTPVGATVPVHVQRDGRDIELKITTAARTPMQGKDVELKSWGITVRDLTRMSAMEKKRPDERGVLVFGVRPGGPSGDAKPALQGGDVIVKVGERAVKDVQSVRQVVRELVAGKKARTAVLVEFEREKEKMLTVVELGDDPDADKPAEARKADLGIKTQVLTRPLAQAMHLEARKGVRVTVVIAGRAGQKAGLKAGDVIMKFDGSEIAASEPTDLEVFPEMIRRYPIGKEVSLEVIREGKPVMLTAKLEAPPPPVADLKRYEDKDLEFTARDLATEDRISGDVEDDVRGVMIEKVENGGWAQLATLRVGDVLISVDGKPTPDTAMLQKTVEEAKKARGRQIVLFVSRGIHTQFLELEPNWEMIHD